jgi:hypothetical protein
LSTSKTAIGLSFVKIGTGGGIYLKLQAGFQRNSGALSPAGMSQFEYIDRKAGCPSGGCLMGALPADITVVFRNFGE